MAFGCPPNAKVLDFWKFAYREAAQPVWLPGFQSPAAARPSDARVRWAAAAHAPRRWRRGQARAGLGGGGFRPWSGQRGRRGVAWSRAAVRGAAREALRRECPPALRRPGRRRGRDFGATRAPIGRGGCRFLLPGVGAQATGGSSPGLQTRCTLLVPLGVNVHQFKLIPFSCSVGGRRRLSASKRVFC